MTEYPETSWHLPATPILVYMPTYAPDVEAVTDPGTARPYARQSNEQIAARINERGFLSRIRPGVYFDCIDSVLNVRPDADLVVADARSSDSVRDELQRHRVVSGRYTLQLHPERESQWTVLNHVLRTHGTRETRYFVYTSSDVVWTMDWVGEAVREFEADPALMILFPCVNSGDPNLPMQVAQGPRDMPLLDPAAFGDSPAARAARAPVLNAYAFIMRVEFLRAYGGYPTAFRNCFTESFLYYMCEAMGGTMRLMPRGWCYHHGSVDGWTDASAVKGGYYYYDAEKPVFDRLMDQVDTARAEGRLTVGFFRRLLYGGGKE